MILSVLSWRNMESMSIFPEVYIRGISFWGGENFITLHVLNIVDFQSMIFMVCR